MRDGSPKGVKRHILSFILITVALTVSSSLQQVLSPSQRLCKWINVNEQITPLNMRPYFREISREVSLIASMLKDRPKQYREDIAKWARAIIEHGKMSHLILQSRSMNFLQYYSLDVIGFLLGIASFILLVTLWILRLLLTKFFHVKTKSEWSVSSLIRLKILVTYLGAVNFLFRLHTQYLLISVFFLFHVLFDKIFSLHPEISIGWS